MGQKNLQKLPLPEGHLASSNTWFLEPTQVYPPIVISIGSAVLQGLRTWWTDRHTEADHATPSAAIGRH